VPLGAPLWSARAVLEAGEEVLALHREYCAAGADVLTANTFRTQRRSLDRAGDPSLAERDREITGLAIGIARRAAKEAEADVEAKAESQAEERRVWVAGSAAPLEDCYRPDLVPDDETLAREHARHAENLAAGGCDLILIETMNTLREAEASARAARESGLPCWLSFICGEDARLLSGEPLASALDRCLRHEPRVVLVNCILPALVTPCLEVLGASGLPFGAYPNLYSTVAQQASATPAVAGPTPATHDRPSPEEFAEMADAWRRGGARVLGGCCGSTPADVRALADHFAALG